MYVNCIPFCVDKSTRIPSYIDLFDRLGLAHWLEHVLFILTEIYEVEMFLPPLVC